MAAGLQCWDASGKLIVDIGDYNSRFLGETTVAIGNNAASVSKAFSGLTQNGSFGVVVGSSAAGGGFATESYAVRTYNGGFTVYSTSTATPASTLTVHLYGFL
ncbi:hypothetical protein WB66_05390 [bacteria symbiont BFo1 of Frankliniella occidentalis]|nr:hypothetical protein AI28_07085 [bacteria symbiont BFo1 of Frankliniella occidentalis]KYP85830.1 hypothetical protein WB66_05390 [bacteria symbiont BFo1 of Frankliniella occidentalis]